jgi:hypothetical protein
MQKIKYIPHEKIYLQIYDGEGDELEDKTWCQDRIHDTDVEYLISPT